MVTSMARRWLVITGVVVAGCAGGSAASAPTPTPNGSIATPSPTMTASATVQASPVKPTPVPPAACLGGAPATAFEADSIVCVVEGPLGIGPRPGLTGASDQFEPLAAGDFLFVIDGPVEDPEYTSYLVQRTPGQLERADGWVAAAAPDGTPWLAVASIDCPASASLEDLAGMDAVRRIHCYHDQAFTFTTNLVWGPNCGDGVVIESPAWMAGCGSTFWWGHDGSELVVAVPPDLQGLVGVVEPEQTIAATVTAHMDDRAALTCKPHDDLEADYELLNPGTVLACRGMFVATSIERLTP